MSEFESEKEPTNFHYYFASNTNLGNCNKKCNHNGLKDPQILDGYSNVSRNFRIAQTLKLNQGAKYNIQEFLPLNYLGRVEGQNGGGGRPIRNAFN